MENEKHIVKEVVELLDNIIHSMIPDPDFTFGITDAHVIPSYSVWFGTYYKTIVVQIRTNNKQLLLGQMLFIPAYTNKGYYTFYYKGYIDGFLQGKYGRKVVRGYDVVLDVLEEEDSYQSPYRYIDLEYAIRKGIISKKSDLVKVMKRYDLKYLLLLGSTISGPSLDMLNFVEALLDKIKVRTVLDIFSGTGSLAKVCLMHNTEFVTCIDADVECINKNLKEYRDRYEVIESDAWSYVPDRQYDLAIVDPFYDLALKTTEGLLSNIRENAKVILLDVSLKCDRSWSKKIIESFKKNVGQCQILHGKISTAVVSGIKEELNL